MSERIELRGTRTLWGRQVENNAAVLCVNVQELMELWPEGGPSAEFRRADGRAYEHALVYDEDAGEVQVTLTDVDTAVPGVARLELSWKYDGNVKKTRIYEGEIKESINDLGEVPAPEYEGLIEQLGDAAARAEAARAQARAAKVAAELAAGEAETFKDAAETAAAYADAAMGAAEDAKDDAEAAKDGAIAAQAGANAAKEQAQQIADGMHDYGPEIDGLQADVNQVKDDYLALEKSKLTAPNGMAVGKYFRVASIDEDGKAVLEAVDLPKATTGDYATAMAGIAAFGWAFTYLDDKRLGVATPTSGQITSRIQGTALNPSNINQIVVAALTDANRLTMTDSEKAVSCQTIGAVCQYKKIADITVEEDTKNLIVYTGEINDELLILFTNAVQTGSSSTKYITLVKENGFGGYSNSATSVIPMYYDSSRTNGFMQVFRTGQKNFRTLSLSTSNGYSANNAYCGYATNDTGATAFRINSNGGSDYIFAGTKIEVYGR